MKRFIEVISKKRPFTRNANIFRLSPTINTYILPLILCLKKTWFNVSFGLNLGILRITSEMKIKLIFLLLMKFYMKSTPILNILNLLFRSASFGKLRLYSYIGLNLISVTCN